MDHPNIARVLDAGATESGRPYFVMELVKGVAIIEYCDQCNLTTRERLELFISVCQAIQHAHQEGIIHRDVKPSNVMIAMQTGEATPKVIDFGVAKAINQRLTEHTLYTRFGQMVGTPMYMSPEQAEMSPIEVDTRSDIYSLGVLLYELLIGATPFDKKRLSEASYDELRRIICEEQPPPPSSRLSTLGDMAATIAEHRRTDPRKLNQLVRGDLDWIVMKALEKDRTRRYETADGLARDIERYLGEEPVEARPPSAAYRFRKFARRNRGYVTAAAAVFLALVAGLVGTTLEYLRAEDARMAESRQRVLAEKRETEAIAAREGERKQRALADQRYEEIIRLADMKRLADARAAADSLWPAHAEKIEGMETWLEAKAAPLRDNLRTHETTLASLRDQALAYDSGQQKHDRETHPKAAKLAEQKQGLPKLRKELDDTEAEESEDPQEKAKKIEELENTIAETEQSILELEEAVQERRIWKFSDEESQWQHDTLAELVEDLRSFVDPDPKKGTVASVEERLEFARGIEERSKTGPEATGRWAEAIAEIARLEVYGGLHLTPQVGLLPLRRDPQSGLWEFRHIQTGTKPELNPDAEAANPWILTGDTGLVFVLIPGGTFWMGAQKDDPKGHNYDPQAEPNESPVYEVTLAAFFISKYEMTQGQWQRFTGANPSLHGPSWSWEGETPAEPPIHQNQPWNPVERVAWTDCRDALDRLGLVLPTEAQWEYAARAGTDSVWWTGNKKESIGVEGAGNLADGWTKRKGGPGTWPYEDWLEDAWMVHAPVGAFSANGFGLHDTIGNVVEWCRDGFADYDGDVAYGDGLHEVRSPVSRVVRGSSYGGTVGYARSAFRMFYAPAFRHQSVGMRPARVITE